MGLTKKKFSLSTLRVKTALPAVEVGDAYDIDTSPPYSPTASEMERPKLDLTLIADLREACAIIVNETNPPDPDEEPEHGEILRRFEEQKRAKHLAQARLAEVKTRPEVKAPKSVPRPEHRTSEKEQKAVARKVEAETRKAYAREAEPEQRQVIAQQADIRMGKTETLRKQELRKEQPRKEQPSRYSSRRPTDDVPSFGPKPEPQTYVPRHVPANFDLLGGKGRSENYNPTMKLIEPTHTKMSAKALGKQKAVDSTSSRSPLGTRSATAIEFLPPVHATIVQNSRARPKDSDHPAFRQYRDSIPTRSTTSTAVRADYSQQSAESSKSTTRSNTEYDNHGRPTSTAMTSAIITPSEDRRISYNKRLSDHSLSEEISPQAKAWQAYKEALRRAEEKYQNSGRAARNTSRASRRTKGLGLDSDNEDERPPSRAGSIAGSITSGISNYLRPRASHDSIRSGRSSASGLSRSHSRSSSMSRRSSNGWWRGAGLRRRGSWSSFRSGRPDGDEPNKLRKNGEPNLNRPLPALPGLDQYRETKKHIGQLMKAGARGRKKEKTPRPDAAYPVPYLPQQQTVHVKKDSISAPILRNSSMERTLHRYRDSQIQPSASHSRQREELDKSPENGHQQQAQRKDSTSDALKNPKTRPSNPDFNSRSTSRQKNYELLPRGSKPRGDSTASATSRSRREGDDRDNNKVQKPPPMIRGPSYQKEVEAGIYPRPMDVNTGDNNMRVIGHSSVTKLAKADKQSKGLKGIFGKSKGVIVN